MGLRGNLVAHANRICIYYEIAALAIDMFLLILFPDSHGLVSSRKPLS